MVPVWQANGRQLEPAESIEVLADRGGGGDLRRLFFGGDGDGFCEVVGEPWRDGRWLLLRVPQFASDWVVGQVEQTERGFVAGGLVAPQAGPRVERVVREE